MKSVARIISTICVLHIPDNCLFLSKNKIVVQHDNTIQLYSDIMISRHEINYDILNIGVNRSHIFVLKNTYSCL
jgi:hypothetical protein